MQLRGHRVHTEGLCLGIGVRSPLGLFLASEGGACSGTSDEQAGVSTTDEPVSWRHFSAWTMTYGGGIDVVILPEASRRK